MRIAYRFGLCDCRSLAICYFNSKLVRVSPVPTTTDGSKHYVEEFLRGSVRNKSTHTLLCFTELGRGISQHPSRFVLYCPPWDLPKILGWWPHRSVILVVTLSWPRPGLNIWSTWFKLNIWSTWLNIWSTNFLNSASFCRKKPFSSFLSTRDGLNVWSTSQIYGLHIWSTYPQNLQKNSFFFPKSWFKHMIYLKMMV